MFNLKMFKYFHICVILLFFFVGVVLSADINEVRRAAIKRLEAEVTKVKEVTDNTSKVVEESEGNIDIIGKHEREYGDGVYETTMFQVGKNAKSAYMLTRLMGYSNDVYRCIESREREAKVEISQYYSDKFLTPGNDYYKKALQLQRDQIRAWKDDYYKNIEHYSAIYEKSVKNIQSSNSESYIASLVREFEKTSQQMSNIITSILPNLTKTQAQILRILDNLVTDLQKFSRMRVEKTYQLINNCFPKSFFDQPLDLF